jgi:hypothetical protein
MEHTSESDLAFLERQRMAARHKAQGDKERREISFEKLQTCATAITTLLQNWITENELPTTVESQVSPLDFFESQIALHVHVAQRGLMVITLHEQGGLHSELFDKTGTSIFKNRADWQLHRTVVNEIAAELLPQFKVLLSSSER